MKKSRYTEEQITYALRQAEAGTPVGDVCRQMGIAEATFYVWKKKYANLGRDRAAQDEATRGRERAAQASGGRSDTGSAHPAGGAPKKSLKPARRREIAPLDPRAVPGEREARVSAGAAAARSTWYLRSQAKDQTPLRMRIREIAYARPIRLPAHPRHAAPGRLAGRTASACIGCIGSKGCRCACACDGASGSACIAARSRR